MLLGLKSVLLSFTVFYSILLVSFFFFFLAGRLESGRGVRRPFRRRGGSAVGARLGRVPRQRCGRPDVAIARPLDTARFLCCRFNRVFKRVFVALTGFLRLSLFFQKDKRKATST